jgi:UDP-N-acetylmuramyl-tripeptide synthetase
MRLSTTLAQTQVLGVSTADADREDELSDRDFFSRRDPEISAIHYRSNEVQPGGLFVAITGLSVDGHDFIDEAIANGAAVIVAEKPLQKKVPVVQVENTRRSLAEISSRFYEHPSGKMTVIGITGTNGKTTTAYLIESILLSASRSCGVIGTVNTRYGGQTYDNPVTTPESLDLQRIMTKMAAAGVTHLVLEVSSHAIDLFRVAHCSFDVGVFTNLTQDHLDYHGDMESYWLCKKKFFFEHLSSAAGKNPGTAVVNCDNPRGKELAETLKIPVITFGMHPEYTLSPYHIQSDLSGISGMLSTPRGDFPFNSQLSGNHNLENLLAAAGVGIHLDLPLEVIRDGIQNLTHVPGRLERIPNQLGRHLYVDYAHTPDALGNVLNAVSKLTTGRLICIFGCGGDRDRQKRPQMGEIAARLCDLAVVTSDNPRTEDPDRIIAQILEGIAGTSTKQYRAADLTNGFTEKGYVVEADRRKAIELGIMSSAWGDTILIAGKGHETYQIVGRQTLEFDDRIEAKNVLNRLASDLLNSPPAETRTAGGG